jgi:superfamily I DNA/RNA helicase
VPVVERAVRLVEHNRERFAKRIRPRKDAPGRLILAPDADDEPARTIRLLRSWPTDDTSRAVLARTNRELRPAVLACLALGLSFRGARVDLLVDDPGVDAWLDRVERTTPERLPLLIRLGHARTEAADSGEEHAALAAAVLAWAPPFRTLDELRAAIALVRDRLAELRRDDAALSLATAHGTKGLEFDHVIVVGMEEGRFPSARSISDSPDPARALEEERRLGYVAWTRARRTLTLSYDPTTPSPFLLEAFSAEELGLEPAA